MLNLDVFEVKNKFIETYIKGVLDKKSFTGKFEGSNELNFLTNLRLTT